MNTAKAGTAQTAVNSIAPMHASRGALSDHFRQHFSAMFNEYPVDLYIRLLDTTGCDKSMYYSAPEMHAHWQNILEKWGEDALEIYHRVTMLELMQEFETRASKYNYPNSIIQLFHQNFARIEKNIATGPVGTYPHHGDNFIKDFSLCRQTAFPGGGAWVVDHAGGFSRKFMLQGGLGQFLRMARLYLFSTRGHRPLYSIHIHNELSQGHTLEERQACHLRIVEMMARHPEIKGMYGISWLTDPLIPTVSPRLRWVREIPEANGCEYFRVGIDIDGGALARSKTRRRLFEEGKYMPTKYLSIWPRKKMMAWARRVTRQSHEPSMVKHRIAPTSVAK